MAEQRFQVNTVTSGGGGVVSDLSFDEMLEELRRIWIREEFGDVYLACVFATKKGEKQHGTR